MLAEGCLARNDWWCPEYVVTRRSELLEATMSHLLITVLSVTLGLLAAVLLVLLARRRPRLLGPIQGVSTALYTIPSLALFALLVPITGLTMWTVVIGLVLYSLTVLVRAIADGLDGVPADVVESATGMGYGARRLLWRVEAPLAVPTVIAGLRVATVSTVALTTVGAIIGYGGLGNLIYSGLRSLFKAEVLTASVLCVLLAVVADLALVGLQRALTPWSRERAVG
jgi:osmoprotectant transport system permease protein